MPSREISEADWIITEAARNGGREIDWGYWGRLPTLTPIEAVCLVHCIDPDHWDNPPPPADPAFHAPLSHEAKDSITKLLRIAEREIKSGLLPEQQSPWRWVVWAKHKGIEINPEFYQAAYKAECDRITVHTVQPLETMEDAAWPHWLSLDYWTVAEAVFLIHGYKPQSGDTNFNGLGDHFIQLNEPVNRAIEAGAIGKMRIERAGVRQYADTPRAWVAWARAKKWPLCEHLRMWEAQESVQDLQRDHAKKLTRALLTDSSSGNAQNHNAATGESKLSAPQNQADGIKLSYKALETNWKEINWRKAFENNSRNLNACRVDSTKRDRTVWRSCVLTWLEEEGTYSHEELHSRKIDKVGAEQPKPTRYEKILGNS